MAALGRRLQDRRWAPAVVLAVGLLAAVENLALPAPLLPLPRSPRTEWTAFLGRQPPGTVVAQVPAPAGGSVEELAPEAWRMFGQIDHRQPLVGGYSSNFPPLHREFMFALGGAFPNHPLACALRRVFRADLLVVDADWLSAHRPGLAALAPLLEPAYADAAVTIFRLQPSETECPPMRIDIGQR
jgi:hypothetical protein